MGIWEDFKGNLACLKGNLAIMIKYQIITKILMTILLLPLFKWISTMLMKSRGYDYLTNGLLQKFLLSPQGAVLVFIGFLTGAIIILLELGGLVVISYQALVGKEESSYRSVLRYLLSRSKQLLSLDGVLLLGYLFVIAPFLGLSNTTSVVSNIKIPGFIMDVIYSKALYEAYLVCAVGLFIFLSIRWSLAMQVILLSPNKVKRPLRESSKLVLKNKMKYIKYNLGMSGLGLLALLVVAIIYVIVSILILAIIPESYANITLYALGGLGLTLFLIFTVITFPLYCIASTRLYMNLSDCKGEYLDISIKEKVNIFDKIIGSKKLLSIAFAVVMAVMSLFAYALVHGVENTKYEVSITAHRGSSYEAPENTISAIKAAIDAGADYAEIDVQETSDGGLILLHDGNFLRTTGTDKKPSEMTLEEVKNLDAGSWFDEKFKGEQIPTLQEVVKFSDGKIKLNIEIKTAETDKELIEKVAAVIKENNFYDKCVVTSLDFKAIEKIEKLDPKIKTGYIMFVALGDLSKMNVDFYSIEETNVTEKFIMTAHAIGREVHVWTINTDASMDNMLELGVDNIITDNVKKLKDKLKTH